MILTRKMINEMRRYSRIDECLERILLKQLGTEPYPHVYTEQDIYEQSRKMIQRYNAGKSPVQNNFQAVNTRNDQEVLGEEIPLIP